MSKDLQTQLDNILFEIQHLDVKPVKTVYMVAEETDINTVDAIRDLRFTGINLFKKRNAAQKEANARNKISVTKHNRFTVVSIDLR